MPAPPNQNKYAAENAANSAAYASDTATYASNIQRSVDEDSDRYEYDQFSDHDFHAGAYLHEPTHIPVQDQHLHARYAPHGPEVQPEDLKEEPFDAEAYHAYHSNLYVRAEDHEHYKLDRFEAITETMNLDTEHAYHIARSLKEYLERTEPDAHVDTRSSEEQDADERFMQLMAVPRLVEEEAGSGVHSLHARDVDVDVNEYFARLKGPRVAEEEAEERLDFIAARGLRQLGEPRVDKVEAEDRLNEMLARGLHQLKDPRVEEAEAKARLSGRSLHQLKSPRVDETEAGARNDGYENANAYFKSFAYPDVHARDVDSEYNDDDDDFKFEDEAGEEEQLHNFSKHSYHLTPPASHPSHSRTPAPEPAHTHPGIAATSKITGGGGVHALRARALPSISVPVMPTKTQSVIQTTQGQGQAQWKDLLAAFMHKHGGEWNGAKKHHARAFKEDMGGEEEGGKKGRKEKGGFAMPW